MNNKKMIAVLLVLLSFLFLSGSDESQEKKSNVEISLNGGLSMKFSDLGRNEGFVGEDTYFAYLLGFKATAVFNKKWYVGGAGYFLGNHNYFLCKETRTFSDGHSWSGVPCINDTGSLSFGYGGLVAGYTFNVKSFFRIETGVLIGGGAFSAMTDYGDYYYKEPFFALEPEVNFLFVITRFLAASINISYRLVTGMNDNSDYSTADMSGPAAGLDIRFGSF